MCFLRGCQAPPDAPPTDAPDYRTVFDSQQERLAQLAYFRSGGVIELHRPEKGFVQGDITVLAALPSRLSFRVHKAGDTYLWVGSNNEQFWFFDLTASDDKVVYVGDYGQLDDDAFSGIVHPLRILDLVGLPPLPPNAELEFDAEENAWRLDTVGRGGPLRIYLDRHDRLPVRVDSLAHDGTILYESRLSRYGAVEAEGLPPGAQPRMPKRIEVREVGGEARMVITLEDLTTEVHESQLERLTDFERLREHLSPDRIERLDPRRPSHADHGASERSTSSRAAEDQ